MKNQKFPLRLLEALGPPPPPLALELPLWQGKKSKCSRYWPIMLQIPLVGQWVPHRLKLTSSVSIDDCCNTNVSCIGCGHKRGQNVVCVEERWNRDSRSRRWNTSYHFLPAGGATTTTAPRCKSLHAVLSQIVHTVSSVSKSLIWFQEKNWLGWRKLILQR